MKAWGPQNIVACVTYVVSEKDAVVLIELMIDPEQPKILTIARRRRQAIKTNVRITDVHIRRWVQIEDRSNFRVDVTPVQKRRCRNRDFKSLGAMDSDELPVCEEKCLSLDNWTTN